MTYKERFQVYKESMPEIPKEYWEIQKYVDFLRKKNQIFNRENMQVFDSNLLTSDEPKVIVRFYNKWMEKKNGKKYSFRFQSIITGLFSQFIPYSDFEKYDLTQVDEITAPFPESYDFKNNYWTYIDKINGGLKKYYEKQRELLIPYHALVENLKEGWKELYHEYLQSPEWNIKRNERLSIDNFKCKSCDTTENLQVHHRHYYNIGDEKMEDLITLCKICHSFEHGGKVND